MDNKIPKDETFTLLHTKGKEYMQHFSDIKMRYKKLTITYITAVFLALAYIATSKTDYVSINKVYIICFIATLSLLGINLIRYLDIHVNHEQIRLIFKYLIHLEEKYPKIERPYIKMNKLLYSKRSDPVIMDFLYYGSINFGIIIFSAIVLVAEITEAHTNVVIITSFGMLVLFLLWEIYSFLVILHRKLKVH